MSEKVSASELIEPLGMAQPETWQKYLLEHGMEPADAPYEPIREEWELFPIVQTIRDWEILTKQKYSNQAPTT